MGEVSEIQNKEMLLYSAEKSVNAVYKLKCEDVSDEEAYYKIGTAIQWLIACFDRLVEIKIKLELQVDKVINSLRFVNNGFKHKPSFKKADIDERFSFPITYPVEYGSKYDFVNFDDVDRSKTPSQYEDYKSELEGRDIINFLSAALDVIKDYYEDL